MKTREEILRLYQEHLGHNHEAGVFAVYNAGVADGRAVREALDAPKAKATPAPVVSTGTATATVSAGTSTATTTVPGKFQPR